MLTISKTRLLEPIIVKGHANAWQAIHRSLPPMGVPAVLRNVNCVA